MVIERGGRGWPESRVPRLRNLLMGFSLLPSWSQVIYPTIAICFAVVLGNMEEWVKTTGPGVRRSSSQVPVPLHTSWGTLGASVSLVSLFVKAVPIFGGG